MKSFVKLPLFLLLSGCVASVEGSSPAPKIALQKQTLKMNLHLDASIQDSYAAKVTPLNGAATTVDVSDWRETLAQGFKNGFGSAFVLVEPSAPADITFDITAAELSFVGKGQNADGTPNYLAQVRVQARAIDKNNQTLAKALGRPQSRFVVAIANDFTRGATDAVESMYEALANQFFGDIASSQPASQMAH